MVDQRCQSITHRARTHVFIEQNWFMSYPVPHTPGSPRIRYLILNLHGVDGSKTDLIYASHSDERPREPDYMGNTVIQRDRDNLAWRSMRSQRVDCVGSIWNARSN